MKNKIQITIIGMATALVLTTAFAWANTNLENFSGDANAENTNVGITFENSTLYVGGTGPNNYTSIQDAIDNASTGDTVYVYNGTYYENVSIPKNGIILLGEDKNNTIIHGEWLVEKVVYIIADNVTVSGFTVIGTVEHGAYGIYADSTDYCNISNNIISDGDYGIYLIDSDYSIVSGNNASHRKYGIYLNSCDNCSVDRNIANSNNEYGIYSCYSSNCELKNNTAKSNRGNNIYLYYSSYSTLIGNMANNSWWGSGIRLQDSDNSKLKGNTVNSNDYGIYLSSSNNCNITNNIANSNEGYGIYLDYSNNNNIRNNIANLNNQDGIYLYHSSNNNITNNTASNNNYGIHLYSTSINNVIAGNTVAYNIKGIYLYYSGNNLLYHNNIVNNTLQAYDHNGFNEWDNGNISGGNYWSDHVCHGNPSNGSEPYIKIDTNAGAMDHYPFENYIGTPFITIYVPDDYTSIQAAVNAANPGDTIIVRDGTYTENVNIDRSLTIKSENGSGTTTVQASSSNDHVFEVTKYYVNINGFTVEGATGNGRAGIYLNNVEHCNIYGNTISNNYDGLRLSSSNYNIIASNNINSNNMHGIELQSQSNNNNITNNIANSNNDYGIHLSHSHNNNITNNNASNNLCGIYLDDSSDNLIMNNTANSNNWYGIGLQSSSNNNITNNIANSNYIGIRLNHFSSYNIIMDNNANSNNMVGIVVHDHSSNNNITNNNASNTVHGIDMDYSNDNIIMKNDLSNNEVGIDLYYSSSNNITNNIANSNNDYGIYLYSSNDNIIYNNYFDNINNAYDNGNNIWNITKTNGTNMIGGPYLGGNYWSDYTGVDLDGDGLGDTPYSIPGSSNTDYLPLAFPLPPPKTIYVDDDFIDDPINHTWDTIQEGLNDANYGDTIIVYNGTYYGAVNITKSIKVLGASAINTTIHGEWLVEKVVYVTAYNVTFSGFTVIGATCEGGYGIYVNADNCNISDNNITDGRYGIYLSYSDNSTIFNNNASGRCADGIHLEHSDGCLIIDNIANLNQDKGIYLRHSSNCKLENNIANSNRGNNIYLDYSGDCTLINNIANNSWWNNGIYLYNSDNCMLENNTVNSNDNYGICLSYSDNCNITNNIADWNDDYGIYLHYSGYNNITNNTVNLNNQEGIRLQQSSNNNITNNTASNNNYGIRLESASVNNIIAGNTVAYNIKGIYIYCSGNNLLYHNNIVNNTLQAYDHKGFNEWDDGYPSGGNYWSDHVCHGNPSNGSEPYMNIDTNAGAVDHHPFENYIGTPFKTIYVPDDYTSIQAAVNATNPGDTIIVRDGIYTENVNIDWSLIVKSENGSGVTTIQASNSNDHVFEIKKRHVNINGFTVEGATGSNKAGIYLGSNVNYCNISGNNVLNNYYGIFLHHSSSNIITNNVANSNYYHGIYLDGCSSNNITNNIVNSNAAHGILLWMSSNNNMLANNTALNNGDCGIRLHYFSCYNTIMNNNVSNNNNGGIYLEWYDCNNNNVTNNIINSNKYDGIYLVRSKDNTLTNNKISNNNLGILLSESSNNNIANNVIDSTKYEAIRLYSSSNNNLIYNNYLNNTYNARDDGTNIWNITKTNGMNIINGSYLGGNYWSDYTGVDLDGDGLGDTPYSIPGSSNTDYLPLAFPLPPPKTIYVDDDFIDDPINHTWDTIQEGLNDANYGDTIIVYNGTYYGAVNVTESIKILGASASNTTIHGEWLVEKVVYVTAYNVTFSGFTIIGATCEGGYGIYVDADNCNISDNNITDGRYGIYLSHSDNSTIFHNNASGRCADGIHLEHSDGCLIIDNIANSNRYTGIYLHYSSNCKLENNVVISNNDNGIYLDYSSNCILGDNIVSGSWQGIRLSYSSNCNITNNIVNLNNNYGIYLYYSNSCNLENNTVNLNKYCDGIYLYYSGNNNITNNVANSNDDYGIHLYSSHNNNITNNNVSNNNGYGMYLYCSGDNQIYHNNFIDNNKQAYDHNGFNDWDKGPIIGGNYWSDHNCTGNPSNGSQPYTNIDTNAGAIDHYPFQNQNRWLNPLIPPENSTIYGYVNDTDSYPIEDAEIHLYNETFDYTYIIWTNETGYYENDTFTGNFSIDAYAEGYSTYQGDIYIPENETIWYNITLSPILNNPPNKPTNVQPADGATDVNLNPILKVHVTDPDGDTMNVTFYNAGNDSIIEIDTNVANDTDASITWNGLSPNTTYSWYVIANDSKLENQSDTWSFTTGTPNASISGTITYSCNGTTISGVIVDLMQNGSLINSTTTDSNGNYTFNVIEPGEYNVTAWKPYFWKNSTVTIVNPGEVTIVNLTLLLMGDLDNNGNVADAVDVTMMIQKSVGDEPPCGVPNKYYDLDWNGISADAVDVTMMIQASVGDIPDIWGTDP